MENIYELSINRRHRKNLIEDINNCEKGGLGGLVGNVTDFVGLTDYSGQVSAQNAAQSYAASSTATAQAQLAFMKQQYADWKSVYGDVQKNLSDYYENLSGSTIASQQLTAQAKEYADAYRQANQTLAQRGMSQSGLAAATDTAMAMQSATTRAGIRASADSQAAAQKAGFLQIGLGQQGTLLSGINSASGQLQQGYLSQADLNQQNYNTLYVSNQKTTQDLIGGFAQSGALTGMGSSLMSGFTSLFSSDVRLKENIRFVGTSASGYNIYSWEWNDKAKELGIADQPTTGVLAQEILHTDAVSIDANGYYIVDYNKLGGE